MEDLLNISEAAKLMGVCENTLRDWDTEKRLIASRTEGGHRRYTIDQVRKYLDEKEQERIKSLKTNPFVNENSIYKEYKDIYSKWSNSEFLEGVESEQDKVCLSIMLENNELYYNCLGEESWGKLTRKQILSLLKESWLKIKFRKMISIQPMLGPTLTVYWKENNDIHSDVGCAKTFKYNFTIYNNMPFDDIKNHYSTSMAEDIDLNILMWLPKMMGIKNLIDINFSDVPLSNMYDYIVATKEYIEILKNKFCDQKIDYYPINTMLDPTSLNCISYAGKYNKNIIGDQNTLIFMPYVMFSPVPAGTLTRTQAFYRAGFFMPNENKNKKTKDNSLCENFSLQEYCK